LVAEELGDGYSVDPEKTEDERDEAAVEAGLKPDLIAFDPAAYGKVLVAAGFRIDFTPMSPPQAEESADPRTEFDPLHGQLFTEVEQQLRHVVEKTLKALDGRKWVKRRVPEEIRQRWEERQEEDRIARRAVFPTVQYADFMDLENIIRRRDNWRDGFQSIFQNGDDLSTSFRRLHPVRKAIAHSRPLSRADFLMLVTESNRIFKALGVPFSIS